MRHDQTPSESPHDALRDIKASRSMDGEQPITCRCLSGKSAVEGPQSALRTGTRASRQLTLEMTMQSKQRYAMDATQQSGQQGAIAEAPQRAARRRILDSLRRELMGPYGGPHERFSGEYPTSRYIVGRMAPVDQR